MRVRKWGIIVLFRDNILTIIDDGVKRVLRADYIKDITIY